MKGRKGLLKGRSGCKGEEDVRKERMGGSSGWEEGANERK